ncbi:hypothetical protein Ciccas_012173 [Cichlidogyrus casuarinus]|uniref:Uncharacterized protein n=1 Tax=Cichlidogyrus casuarinus TaxID=1844966 RepID=A0ABD2PPX0_9PLAT
MSDLNPVPLAGDREDRLDDSIINDFEAKSRGHSRSRSNDNDQDGSQLMSSLSQELVRQVHNYGPTVVSLIKYALFK